MGFFNVTTYGLEGIDTDVTEEMTHIYAAVIPEALKAVGSEMVVNLQQHIKRDWYKPWGKPIVYVRKTDEPSESKAGCFPLGDKRNMDYTVSGSQLEFDYHPEPDRRYYKNTKITGDRLIEIIQTNTRWSFPPSEDTKGRQIMPRPFWNNFVDDQVNGGIVRAFTKAMKSQGYSVSSTRAGGDVTTDGSEKLEG